MRFFDVVHSCYFLVSLRQNIWKTIALNAGPGWIFYRVRHNECMFQVSWNIKFKWGLVEMMAFF